MKNMVVVIEGPDGAGKTTLVKDLKEDINNKRPELKVLALSLPNKESFGYDRIRDILKSKVDYPTDIVQSLFVVNMIDCADNIIKPFLNESGEDHIVLLDRSLISTIIYNETCNGTLRSSIEKYVYSKVDEDDNVNFDIINKIYCHFPTVDYTFFLLPPIDILIKHSTERHSDEINDTESLVREREHTYRECYNYISGNMDRLRGGQHFFWWPDENTWKKYIILDAWTSDWPEKDNYARYRRKILYKLKI